MIVIFKITFPPPETPCRYFLTTKKISIMKPFKSQPFDFIFTAILILLVSSIIFTACNNDGDNHNSNPATVTTDSTQCWFGAWLDTLELSSADYAELKNTFPSGGSERSKLVFQFYFDKTVAGNPSLIAYASKPGNQFTQGTVTNPVSKVLKIGGPHALQLPNTFVLGDQQIRFDSIDGILSGAATDTIIFIPTIKPGEINVRYKICLKGAACPSPAPITQPSPPANAN
jgi:hypothetical protein